MKSLPGDRDQHEWAFLLRLDPEKQLVSLTVR